MGRCGLDSSGLGQGLGTRMDRVELGWEGLVWIHVAWDRDWNGSHGNRMRSVVWIHVAWDRG
jgi:hypothetical protein